MPTAMSNVKTRPFPIQFSSGAAYGAALERENLTSALAREICALKPYFRVARISGVMCQSNW